MDHSDEGVAKAESTPSALPTNAQEKPRFVGLYREDVVQNVSQPEVMGMVTKVAGDSDSDSSSDSEDEEEDEAESIQQGCARVCWINSDESTEKIQDIRVVDRAFLHGDIVAAVASPLGQTGTVVNVDLSVDVELPNGEILKEVDSRKLERVRSFAIGDYVIYDHWLGRVDEVVDNVTLMFDDGSKCKVMRADPERLLPVSESPIDDSGCPYYPGQRVKGSSSLYKNARWLRGSWKPNRAEGVVIDVEAGSVVVYWIAAAHSGYHAQTTAIPSEQQDPKRLKPMTYLSYTNWQLGDRALLPKRLLRKYATAPSGTAEGTVSDGEVDVMVENDSVPGPVSEPGSNSVSGTKDLQPDNWVAYRRKLRRRFTKREKKAQKKDDIVERALLIVNTKTKVDVAWQDGTRECGLEACTLFPVDHLGDHDFWPEQYVLERGSDLEGSYSETRHVGIVKSVDSKQRTAKVRWLRSVERPEEPRQFENEEVVSVYELAEHPDYTYCLGDVVIRLCSASDHSVEAPVDESEAAASSGAEDKSGAEHEETEQGPLTEARVSGKENKGKTRCRRNVSDLSWVGVIIGLQDGDIEVAWADASVSKVGPQAVFVVGRDEDDGSSQSSGIEDAEEGDDAGSWETVDSSGLDELETEEQDLEQSEWDERDQCQGSGDAVDETNGTDESSSEGKSHNVTSWHRESSFAEGSSHGIGGALTLPLAAIIRALKFAASLLWSLKGSKNDSILGEPISVENTLIPTRSYDQTMQKHGLEKLPDESENGAEQLGEFPKGELQGHSQELSAPSNQNVLRMLDASQAGVEERENCEQVATSQKTSCVTVVAKDGGTLHPRDAEDAERISTPLAKDSDCKKEHLGEKHRLKVGESFTVEDKAIKDSIMEDQPRTSSLNFMGFKRFDSVKDPSDHYFLSETGQPSNQRKWSKKIQQEWSILEKNLPETIYVRVYEDRMDLLRSVIVGAAGTPYHNGLFVLDLYLPPEYPNVPPLAHYHSGGLRLNPNLYETGKVCLSLLNTWTGKGNEIWHPSTSSILQVLVSIQGLVLNAKPYFNEAGYDKQIGTAEGEKNSLAYNENSFLLSCKSMLYLIRRPPKHFEELVRDHFKYCGPYILRACNSYMQGSPVGSLSEDATVSPFHCMNTELTSSAGFRLMLAKLIPRLVAAFTEAGADCNQFMQIEVQ